MQYDWLVQYSRILYLFMSVCVCVCVCASLRLSTLKTKKHAIKLC